MTANVSVSNTTSLYQGSGPVNVLTSTQALYNIFSNSGNVQFSLIDANTRISANAINLNNTGVSAGTYGSDTLIPVFTVQADGRVTGVVNTPISGALGSYGNSNVAAYLPTYTGSLENSSSVINLWSNAVSQQTQINTLLSNAATQSGEITTLFTNAATQATAINTLNANLGAFETYANATFTVSSYGNANVAAYLPTDPTIIALQSNAGSQQTSINTLLSNAATQASQIAVLDANLGTATTNVTALFSNAAAQATAIDTLNANLGAFETYANATFGTSNYGNANVAAYLPTYTGSLENSSSIMNLWANAATQSTDIAARALIAGQVFTGNISAPYVIANTAVKGPGSVPDGGDQYAALVKNSATGYDYSWTTDIKAAKVTEIVENSTGSTIAKGTPVYQTGVVGNTPTVAPADASDPNKMPAIGVAGASIGAGAQDIMIVLGNINGVDTSAFATGDAIYVAAGGGYTNVLPQGATTEVQFLGVVTRVNASSGSGFVTGTLSEETFRRLTATGEFQGWTGNAWITIPGTYSNSNVAAYLPSYTGDLNPGNVNVSGTLTSDDITSSSVYVNGNAIITGNLFVEGNVTTINSNVITTNDLNITVGNNISSASLLTGAGLIAGNPDVATWLYDYNTNSWQSNINILSTNATQNLGSALVPWNNVYATTLHGDASQVTGLANNSTIQAIDANLGVTTNNINTLFSNAASQQTLINSIDANLGTATTNITTLFSNAATQAGQIDTLNANVGAFETYANAALANVAFTGNLRGNALIDSVLGHVFINASPYSQPTVVTGGLTAFITTPVVYSGGALQPQNSQTTGLIATSNVGLQASYQTSTNKTAIGHYLNSQWWPVTANTMNNRDRIRGSSINTEIILTGNVQWNYSGGGASTVTLVSNGTNLIVSGNGAVGDAVGQLVFMSIAPVGGSANVRYASGFLTNLGWGSGGAGAMASNIEYARGYTATVTTNASHLIQNAVGFHTPSNWAGTGSTVTRRYALLNEDSATTIATNGNLTVTASSGNVWINNGSNGLIYLDSGTGAASNLYARANTMSFVTNTTGQFNFAGGNINMPPNVTLGATGTTTNFNGNVVHNGVTNSATFFGNLVAGTTSSYTVLRGTTLLQGNVNFDAPYYEKVNTGYGSVSGTLSIDTGLANTFTMTLTGNITLNTTSFTNLIAGKSITLILTQDGTGGRYLTSNLKYSGGISTLSTAAGAIDVLNMYYDGTNYLASLVKGYQ